MLSKKIILAGSGIVILIIAIVAFFVLRQPTTIKQQVTPTPSPQKVKHLKDFQNVETDGVPDIRHEQLPDGRRIEYGSQSGPLSPEREQELKKLIEEEKNKPQSDASLHPLARPKVLVAAAPPAFPAGFFFSPLLHWWSFLSPGKPVLAATPTAPEDALIVDLGTAYPPLENTIRNLFRAHVMYWTPGDLNKLKRIKLLADNSTIGGALGAWDYIRIDNADGSFSDLQGIIWIWQDGPVEEAVIHEYGHHYTNYWAAHRTNGAWTTTNRWPVDPAGDYYAMRPLRDGCSCGLFDAAVCPYQNRIWEILAEDFRETATVFNTGHIFAGASCITGGGTVGQPDVIKTAAYLAALPLNTGSQLPTVPYCLDSDHGKDYGVSGSVLTNASGWQPTTSDQCVVKDNAGQYTKQQSCSAPNCYVVEYYCADTAPMREDPPQACSGGCQNGACLGTNGAALPTITRTPFDGGPSPNPTFFPKTPFESCFAKGGVCTQQSACFKFRGTTFQKDTTVCPTSEGCCIFPHPVPIAPTQTPCEVEGGICTNFPSVCTAQGGTIDGSKGCSTQCCKFASQSKTYTNQDYQALMSQIKNGTMGSLAASAWIENACRTPGLQTMTCNPKKEGDCERLSCVR